MARATAPAGGDDCSRQGRDPVACASLNHRPVRAAVPNPEIAPRNLGNTSGVQVDGRHVSTTKHVDKDDSGTTYLLYG
jgi:hypothetical protein